MSSLFLITSVGSADVNPGSFLSSTAAWIAFGALILAWICIATHLRHKRICEECDRLRDEASSRQTGGFGRK